MVSGGGRIASTGWARPFARSSPNERAPSVSVVTMWRSKGRRGCISVSASASASPRANSTEAPQSRRMISQSFARCASYIVTNVAPRPYVAYSAAAHSALLRDTIATRSPWCTPSAARPPRSSSTISPISRYDNHDHVPSWRVPNSGRDAWRRTLSCSSSTRDEAVMCDRCAACVPGTPNETRSDMPAWMDTWTALSDWFSRANELVPKRDRKILLSPPRLVARFARFALAHHRGDAPHAGTEGVFLSLALYERFGIQRAVYALAHDFLFEDPILRRYAMRLGMVRAGHASAHHAFEEGGSVIVFPGSYLVTFRTFHDRNKIVLGGRKGFVKLALREHVPIVPFVTAGTHEQFIVLSRGDWLAKLVHAHEWARTEVLPLVLSLPWGLTSGFVPYLPLPAQTTVSVLPAMRWTDRDPEDPAAVERCYQEVEAAMQHGLDELTRGRHFLRGQPPALAPTRRRESHTALG